MSIQIFDEFGTQLTNVDAYGNTRDHTAETSLYENLNSDINNNASLKNKCRAINPLSQKQDLISSSNVMTKPSINVPLQKSDQLVYRKDISKDIKKNLIYPGDNSKFSNQKEKPGTVSVVTSDAWMEDYNKKEAEKLRIEQEKAKKKEEAQRKRERIEMQKEEAMMHKEKIRKQKEEIKKHKEEIKKYKEDLKKQKEEEKRQKQESKKQKEEKSKNKELNLKKQKKQEDQDDQEIEFPEEEKDIQQNLGNSKRKVAGGCKRGRPKKIKVEKQ